MQTRAAIRGRGLTTSANKLLCANGLNQGSVAYLSFISVVSALGGFLFGFDTVVISGTIDSVKQQFALSSTLEGWLVSSGLLGCAVGAACGGVLSDRLGRKPVLILSAALFLLCSVGCAFAWNVNSLICWRVVGGVGVGLASIISPLYISEVSIPELRGRMVALFQFAITIGICAALISNAGLASVASSARSAGLRVTGLFGWMVVSQTWRSMLGIETLPSLLFLLACFAVPETPRYLVQRGKMRNALAILTRIAGEAVGTSELKDIQASISAESGSLRQLFQPGLRRALFIALFLAIESEMSGITIVFYYGPGILERAGFSLGHALGGFVSIGIVNVVFTIIALWLLDTVGRRPLLFIGNAGAFISLLGIGYCFLKGQTGGIELVVLLCLFVAFFAFSLGPIKWVVISEIFPTKIRGRAMAICILSVWVTDALYNQFFPIMRDRVGVGGIFFTFAVVLLPQFLFIWKVMPETKGKSLEDIEFSWTEHS